MKKEKKENNEKDKTIKIIEHDEIDKVAEIFKRGELVAVPTETVYGLAADTTNLASLNRIFEVKQRPKDDPLIVHF